MSGARANNFWAVEAASRTPGRQFSHTGFLIPRLMKKNCPRRDAAETGRGNRGDPPSFMPACNEGLSPVLKTTFTSHHLPLSTAQIVLFAIGSTEAGMFQAAPCPVILKGEISGTGWGLRAALHGAEGRRADPWVPGTLGLGGPGDAAPALPRARGSARSSASGARGRAAPRRVRGAPGGCLAGAPASSTRRPLWKRVYVFTQSSVSPLVLCRLLLRNYE